MDVEENKQRLVLKPVRWIDLGVLVVIVAIGLVVAYQPRVFTSLISRLGIHDAVHNDSGTNEPLGIPAVVDQLERELRNSERDHLEEGKPGLFLLGDVDVELTVVAKSSAKVNGSVELEVVKAGSELEYAREATHKVTLHLHPLK
jgi:hypothetical protein